MKVLVLYHKDTKDLESPYLVQAVFDFFVTSCLGGCAFIEFHTKRFKNALRNIEYNEIDPSNSVIVDLEAYGNQGKHPGDR
jgi:hypothetical protein